MKIESQLNNIFDQYDLGENRLTNALLQMLSKNEDLLIHFLKYYFKIHIKKNTQVLISALKEAFATGDREENREEVESIPDGWIIVNENIAIVFEAKITQNAIRRNQLLSHVRRIRNIEQKYLCVITPDHKNPVKNIQIPNVNIVWISWRKIYNWVSDNIKDNPIVPNCLTKQFKEYLAMKENLVGFQGINFSSGKYDSSEAKRILKSLLKEITPEISKIYPKLRTAKKALSEGVHDYTVYHRNVWSNISAGENFTKDMHMTFWIQQAHFGMGFTVPNNARSCWKRLKSIFKDEILFNAFIEKLFKLRNHAPNLFLEFIHRHYLGMKQGVVDGLMEINIDTIRKHKNSPVKSYPSWLVAFRELITNKKGFNGQFMMRTRFFYKDHPKVRSADFKDVVLQVAKNFKEIYDFLQQV